MPCSTFGRGIQAIHGTLHVKRLGHSAWSGGVRLASNRTTMPGPPTGKIGVGNLKVVIKN